MGVRQDSHTITNTEYIVAPDALDDNLDSDPDISVVLVTVDIGCMTAVGIG